jgi:hypothetical protein
MCTLSFNPTYNGFHLAMNRDESLRRPQAEAPTVVTRNGVAAIYPQEPSGGTWIGLNENGNVLALLNIKSAAKLDKTRSRGTLIPKLITTHSIHESITKIDCSGLLPFLLVSICARELSITEWEWDGSKLRSTLRPWQRQHWFSSSISDVIATMVRGEEFAMAEGQAGAGSIAWMRALHRSHQNGPGPFSICMHRQDAATVSYSEIVASDDYARFSYSGGSPCLNNPLQTVEIPLSKLAEEPRAS